MMAYFATIGHFLDESGSPHILVDTEVLVAGSLQGFITGKHFNHCKKLHPNVSRSFLGAALSYGSVPEILQQKLHTLNSPAFMEPMETLLEYTTLMAEYAQFPEKTRSSHHRETARYWTLHIDLVHVFLQISRVCCSSDLELFTYSLRKMCAMFFATNLTDYACYMVRYFRR